MSDLLPEGTALRKAVKWISEQLKDGSANAPFELIHEAISLHNLSPAEAETLIAFYGDAAKR